MGRGLKKRIMSISMDLQWKAQEGGGSLRKAGELHLVEVSRRLLEMWDQI